MDGARPISRVLFPPTKKRSIAGRASTLLFEDSEVVMGTVDFEVAVTLSIMKNPPISRLRAPGGDLCAMSDAYPVPPVLEAVKVEIHDRRCVQRQQLAYSQPTDDGDA